MLNKKILIFISTCLLFISSVNLRAQSFGFGCLGFVGAYGGYSYQQYSPAGLNDFIKIFNENRSSTLNSPMPDFGTAQGYRVGINLFRANFSGIFVTAKGFYQSLSEKKETSENISSVTTNYTYEVEIKNWGIGIDLGIDLNDVISWKIIDGALHFNNATFINTENIPGETKEIKYNNDKSRLGYSVGSGFIIDIVGDYISLEGLAGYTMLRIGKLQTDTGIPLPANEDSVKPMGNFIDAGGFSAVIQLNIGFPL